MKGKRSEEKLRLRATLADGTTQSIEAEELVIDLGGDRELTIVAAPGASGDRLSIVTHGDHKAGIHCSLVVYPAAGNWVYLDVGRWDEKDQQTKRP
jgi:hypothetical protein